jgi:O-antigen/teichoic acid export membrane protein
MRGATVVWLGLGTALGVGTDVVVARLAGPAGFGTYAYILVVTQVAAAFGILGLDWHLYRSIPAAGAAQVRPAVPWIAAGALVAGVVAAVVVLFAGYSASAWLAAAGITVAAVAIAAADGVLRGCGEGGWAMFARQVAHRAPLGILVGLCAVVPGLLVIAGPGLSAVVALATGIGALVAVALARRACFRIPAGPSLAAVAPPVLGMVATMTLVNGLGILIRRVDVLVAEGLLPPVALGTYLIAQRISVNAVILNMAVAYHHGPRLAAAWAAGDRESFAAGLAVANRWCLCATAMTVAGIAAGLPLLASVFTVPIDELWPPMAVLLLNALIEARLGLVGNACVLVGRARGLAGCLAAGTAVGFVSAWPLIWWWGAIGAAVALSVGNVVFRYLSSRLVAAALEGTNPDRRGSGTPCIQGGEP